MGQRNFHMKRDSSSRSGDRRAPLRSLGMTPQNHGAAMMTKGKNAIRRQGSGRRQESPRRASRGVRCGSDGKRQATARAQKHKSTKAKMKRDSSSRRGDRRPPLRSLGMTAKGKDKLEVAQLFQLSDDCASRILRCAAVPSQHQVRLFRWFVRCLKTRHRVRQAFMALAIDAFGISGHAGG
jgi:hypothetical protein